VTAPISSHRFGPFLIALAALAAAAPASAQDGDGPVFTIDASARVRFEALGGQYRPNTAKDDAFLSFRSIVAAKLDWEGFTLGGEVIDARGYLQDERSSVRTGEVNTLEPVQAYAAYHFAGPFGGTTTVTGGRWVIDIGSSRLVSRVDWPNTVPSYLGAKADWTTKNKDRVVAFWGKPFQALPDAVADIRDNEVELDRAGGNLTFMGASGTKAKALGKASLEVYGYRLVEDDRGTRQTRNRRIDTAGSRLFLAPDKGQLDYELEGAYQWGTTRLSAAASDETDVDVRAGFVHGEIGWTAPSGWTPRLAVMFDYASPDGQGGDTYGRFDQLYGAARPDFGPRGLFSELGRANIVSPAVRLEAKPSPRFDLMMLVRDVYLADKRDSFNGSGIRDATGASGNHPGWQVEGRARRWLVPAKIKTELGGAWFARGDFLKRAPNAPQNGDTLYGYVDLTVAF
jgi:hypothetical protein